jgi:SAM-dependent methyltransferase
VYPKPPAHEIEKYYQDATFYSKAESEELRLIAEAKTRVKFLSKLAEKYGLEKRLLDVGCASGIFLEQAQKDGWVVEGIELSPILSAEARTKGLTVLNGLIEELPIHTKYPVVTAWEVIEHTINPEKFLYSLRSRVQDGGFVALSTPLSNGLPALVLRSRFPMLCPPEHLSIFSKQSLQILGKELGLEMINFQSFSNLAKENLERGLFRYVFGSTPLPDAAAKQLSSLLAIAISPLPKVIDAMSLGSEMQVVLRKTP